MIFDNISSGSTDPLDCATPYSVYCLSFTSFSQLFTPRLSLVATIVIILAAKYARSPWRRVPPGPKGLPILGNALQFQDRRWMFQKECKQNFEHMMYLNVLGQPFIVFNSLKPAYELLERRANLYSDRPRLVVCHEILCGGLFVPSMPYGDVWRRVHRAAHGMLTKAAVRDYRPVFFKEAILLASAILKTPDALERHFKRAAASAIMSILYDHPTLETENDKAITEVHELVERLAAAAAPGAHLVELFPWMIHIPERFSRWKREVMGHSRQHTAMLNGLLSTVRNDIAKGSERPSVGASLVKNSDRNELSNDELAWLLGTLYVAGSDTTATTLAWWALAMIAYPKIQKQAQDELDAAVGRSRPPIFADAPNLPFMQAVVKESLRWRPVGPFALPHRTTEDDWYEGTFIPKGTICMANLWQCHHDPAHYGDDAANFNPERFLDECGRPIPGPREAGFDGHRTYGFGRRACVGKHAANDSLFVYMATILWATRLERLRDESGSEVPLDTETPVDTGMSFQPLPYSCKITPRFPDSPSILAGEIELLRA